MAYRQYNGPKKNDKVTNNDLQNIKEKTKKLIRQTSLKKGGGGERRFGTVSVFHIRVKY